jgi:uncharacterized protein YkwD
MTRTTILLFAVLFAALIATAGPAAPRARAGVRLSHSERAMIRLVNDVRARNGLGRLRVSRALSRAADRHSLDMLRRDFFDHSSSDGTTFDRRVRRYADARSVGETLAAIGQRRGGAAMVVRMWMESPPHRAVLLGSGFSRIGIARRWGTLGGAWRSVVTADFASRR